MKDQAVEPYLHDFSTFRGKQLPQVWEDSDYFKKRKCHLKNKNLFLTLFILLKNPQKSAFLTTPGPLHPCHFSPACCPAALKPVHQAPGTEKQLLPLGCQVPMSLRSIPLPNFL